MRILNDYNSLTHVEKNIIALGNFDGIHIGHNKLIEKLHEYKTTYKAPTMVLTFNPHPLKVINSNIAPKLLLTLKEKIDVFKRMGIDYLLIANFTKKFSQLSKKQFVYDILIKKIKPRVIVVGSDYKFGRNNKGNINDLLEIGESNNFYVEIIPPVKYKDQIVSSSLIREYLQQGKINEANSCLGRLYTLNGKVVKGSGIGKKLGFPTANLQIDDTKCLPRNGVYYGKVKYNEIFYNCLIYIGNKPTFKEQKITVEIFILDFKFDIYFKNLIVFFEGKIRNEKKYDSENDLIIGINKDIRIAKKCIDS